jgi:hypothetical protein
VSTRSSSRSRAGVSSDGSRGGVGDGVSVEGDAVQEPMPGGAIGELLTNGVDVEHGNGEEAFEGHARVGGGDGDSRLRAGL